MNNDSFFNIMNTGKVRFAVTSMFAVLTVLLLVLTISIWSGLGRSGIPATDTITVQGTGEASLVPDIARISFTVENTAATVDEAQTQSTKQSNAALEYVKSQKVAEKDIKTLSYNIYPEYSYSNPCYQGVPCPAYGEKPRITGYRVSQTIQVTIRDLTTVGELLSGLPWFFLPLGRLQKFLSSRYNGRYCHRAHTPFLLDSVVSCVSGEHCRT